MVPEAALFCPLLPTQLWDGTTPPVSFAGGVLHLSRMERGEMLFSCLLSLLFNYR